MKKSYNLILTLLLVGLSSSIQAQTAGSMTFNFTPINPGAGWHSETNQNTGVTTTETDNSVLAVWIESCATCGSGTTVGTSTFVRTKLLNVGTSTKDHLPAWAGKSGCTSSANATHATCNTTNATTGATLTTFTAKTVTWDGKNAAQTTLLADGNYRMCVQETWGHGASTVTRYFPFVKGTTLYTNTTDVANDANFSGISLTWTPNGLAKEEFVTAPEAVVYPNPSNGIFNVEFNKEVKNVKVNNILGEEVYNENVEVANETKKVIDLSNLANGVYLISVSNGKNTSSYKVVLDK